MSSLIQEQIAHEKTKVELYKAQFQILNLMGQTSMDKIAAMEAQAVRDAADARDMPSDATKQPDPYTGS